MPKINNKEQYCCPEHRKLAYYERRDVVREKNAKRPKPKEREMSALAQANAEARAMGLSYGKWQVKQRTAEIKRVKEGLEKCLF